MEARNGRLQAALNGIQPATCQGIKRHQVQVVGYIKRRSVRVFQQGAVKSHLAHMLPVRNAAYMLQVLKRWRQCWQPYLPRVGNLCVDRDGHEAPRLVRKAGLRTVRSIWLVPCWFSLGLIRALTKAVLLESTVTGEASMP